MGEGTLWMAQVADHGGTLSYMMVLTVLDLPTCQGDLLGRKSQLDLRLFGVGVPAVGHKVIL